MPTDQSVRKLMNSAGYANERIGYDPNSGYVQYNGQNFMKPKMNVGGTTFDDPANFNAADTTFRQQNPNLFTINAQTSPQTSQYQGAQTSPYQGAQAVNPQDQQINELVNLVRSRITNPQPYNVYASPEYRAQQQQAQYGAQQAIGAGQEALGTTGMARSSDLARFAQTAQNEANQRLMTQVVPQLIAQQRAQQQQELANYFPLINTLASQQQVGDVRQQREIENQIAKAGLTGTYMPPGATDIINRVLNLKQQAEQPGVTPEQMLQFKSEADKERARLSAMGIDPSMVGFEAGYGEATQNVAGFRGIPTVAEKTRQLAQQNLEEEKAYRAEKDTEENRRWWADYERKGQEFAAQQGVQWAQLDQREKESLADEAYRQSQLGMEQQRIDIEKTKSPKGKIDQKTSTDNYSLLYDDLQTEGLTKETARQLIEANRDELTDSDYKKLNDYVNQMR